MKITRSTTKEQLTQFIGANVAAVKKQDKNLFDQIAYADKQMKTNPKKVTRADLVQLAKDIMNLLGDKVKEAGTPKLTPVTAENSVKPQAKLTPPKGKKDQKAEPKKDEEPKEEPAKKPPVKGNKKADPKKQDTKKDEEPKKTLKSEVPMATKDSFPQTLKVGDETYSLAEDITNMDKLYDSMQAGEEIVFAYYWSKRLLKQFPYFADWLGRPKSFDNDLDLTTTIYVSDEKKVSYQISMYTEAIYTILPDDFEVVDGIRCAGGIEYQIYRKVAETK